MWCNSENAFKQRGGAPVHAGGKAIDPCMHYLDSIGGLMAKQRLAPSVYREQRLERTKNDSPIRLKYVDGELVTSEAGTWDGCTWDKDEPYMSVWNRVGEHVPWIYPYRRLTKNDKRE